MTPEENTQDRELLERYRRASDTLDAAPSDAVRAAILAEGRRAAEERSAERRAAESARPAFDASRPAANDSRWKITAFGTAGAALVAALLFAPRWWESGPGVPATSSGAPAAAVPRNPSSEEKAGVPQLESVAPPSPTSFVPPQAPAPAAQTPRAGNTSPRATALQSRSDWPAPPQRQQADATAQAAAPAERSASANAAAAAAPAASATPPAAAQAARFSSVSDPAALLSAAAAGDVARAAVLLDQGGAADPRDERGRTPLMLAVMQNRPEVVRLLLDRGADPNAADSRGRTPLQQAKQDNLREIAAQLERAGAR